MTLKKSPLVHKLSRYIDLEKAGRNYKASFAVAVVAWAVRTGLMGLGAVEFFKIMDGRGVFETIKSMSSDPDFAVQAVLYGGLWIGLKLVQWVAAVYGGIGAAVKNAQENAAKNALAAQAVQEPPTL